MFTPALENCIRNNGSIRCCSHFGKQSRAHLTTSCRIATMRAAAGGFPDRLRLQGCPVPYGQISEDLGGFREIYQQGCFSESAASDDLRVLYNHNPDYVLGRKSAGTMIAYEQPDGLYIECDPPDTTYWMDLCVSMDRGDIDQMSAAFYITQQRWENRGSQKIRVVERGQLVECSVVSFAAYNSTTASIIGAEENQLAAASSFLKAAAMNGRIK